MRKPIHIHWGRRIWFQVNRSKNGARGIDFGIPVGFVRLEFVATGQVDFSARIGSLWIESRVHRRREGENSNILPVNKWFRAGQLNGGVLVGYPEASQ